MKKVNLKSKQGFIMIMTAFFIPIVMLLFYFNVRSNKNSYTRMIFEHAVKIATLDTARKYINGITVANQQVYLDRVASVSFDNSMKCVVGLNNNIIPLSIKNVGYNKVACDYFNNETIWPACMYMYGTGIDMGAYYSNTVRRTSILSNADYFTDTDFDPETDTIINTWVQPYSKGNVQGYLLKRSDTGSLDKTTIHYKSTATNDNTITVSSLSSDKVKVEASVVIDNKRYVKSYNATAPILNADIVIGLPCNTAASTVNNDPYESPIWDTANDLHKSTPLWQIKTECRKFVKKLLNCRNCAIGLIPYSGTVVLPGEKIPGTNTDYSLETFGAYKYSDYPAVNPTVPISESYKFRANNSDRRLDLNYDESILGYGAMTLIMYRSDLEPYLEEYMKNGTTNQTGIENILYSAVTNSTIWKYNSQDIIYASLTNILAGYSKESWATYPIPYPMLGLTQKAFDIYRYFALVAPFRNQFQRSSFVYLPVMFGISMLANGFLNDNSYPVIDTNRKKILILIVNQADLWQPRELTYFGFANDASYISMVDGDRIDYEKGVLEEAGDGYYRSKIYKSSDVKYGTGNYSAGSNEPGQFLNAYDAAIAIKSNYVKGATSGQYSIQLPKPGNMKIVLESTQQVLGKPCMLLYESNKHCGKGVITNVQGYNGGIVIHRDEVYYCYIPKNATDAYFLVYVNKVDESPVYAKAELRNCEIMHSNLDVYQDKHYVYFCADNNDTTSFKVEIAPIADSSGMIQYPTLSYFNKNILSANDASAHIAQDTTQIVGNAYNVTLGLHMYWKTPNISLSITSPADTLTENIFSYAYHYMDLVSTTYTEDMQAEGREVTHGYRGIYSTANPTAPNSENIQFTYLPGIDRIEAMASTPVIKSFEYDGIGDKHISIYKYQKLRDFSTPEGQKATIQKREAVTNVTFQSGLDEFLGTRIYYDTKEESWRVQPESLGNFSGILNIAYSSSLPSLCKILCKIKPHNMRVQPNDDTQLYADGINYYIESTSHPYTSSIRFSTQSFTPIDAIAIVNNNILTRTHTRLINPSFNPYYIYSTNAKLTAYSNDSYNTHHACHINFSDICKNISLCSTYKKIEQLGQYSAVRYLISFGNCPEGYEQNVNYSKFMYGTIYKHNIHTRNFKSASPQPPSPITREMSASTPTRANNVFGDSGHNAGHGVTFSGNYTKSYTLASGYNVIYIPRDKISANLNNNDSATVSLNLNGAKIISIEWSNHLNGTEGCYSCADSNGTGAKLSDGITNAVYYQKLTRSKNSRAIFFETGSSIPFGHDTINAVTETNGHQKPDYDANWIYLSNKTTARSRQYTRLIKNITGSNDHSLHDGTWQIIYENVNRISNLFGWTEFRAFQDNIHGTEFNYINCVGRYADIFPYYKNYNPQTGYDDIAFCTNAPVQDYIAKIALAECTIDVNRIMLASGYQKCTATDTNGELMDHDNTELMRSKVTPKMIKAFNDKFGNDGRIYVVHYRYNKDGFSHWQPSKWGVHKNYMAANQKELQRVLFEIYRDIQDFSEYQNAKLVD